MNKYNVNKEHSRKIDLILQYYKTFLHSKTLLKLFQTLRREWFWLHKILYRDSLWLRTVLPHVCLPYLSTCKTRPVQERVLYVDCVFTCSRSPTLAIDRGKRDSVGIWFTLYFKSLSSEIVCSCHGKNTNKIQTHLGFNFVVCVPLTCILHNSV